MSNSITLRLGQRSDIPTLARIANAANANSVLHKRMAPGQHQSPISYYHWRLNIVRERFATPNLRTVVAEDASTSDVLGMACWVVEGPETALYKRWVGESTWANWLDSKLIEVEKIWCRYVSDQSVDYRFLDRFMAAFQGAEQPAHPSCIRCHQIVVDPSIQSRGVGRMLIEWGKELAVKEGLPLYLEANLEVAGFYEKGGFSRLSKDLVICPEGQEAVRIPVFAWEGSQREGRWLERDETFDGAGARWRWKDDVLFKESLARARTSS